MGKRAEISILAHEGVFAEGLAEFTLVATGVIQLLNFIMGFLTIAVAFGARDVIIRIKFGPPFILIVMVVKANFSFMLVYII